MVAGGAEHTLMCRDRFSRIQDNAGHLSARDDRPFDFLAAPHCHRMRAQRLEKMSDQVKPLPRRSRRRDPLGRRYRCHPRNLPFRSYVPRRVLGRGDTLTPVPGILAGDQTGSIERPLARAGCRTVGMIG